MDRERTPRLLVVREGESLPTATIDLFLVRAIVQVAATADTEYICLRTAAGAYAWVIATDATLSALAALDGSAGFLVQTAADTFAKAFLANYLVFATLRDNTDFTNTDTANDADAVSTTIVLPAGTWSLWGFGYIVASHSAVGNQRCTLSLDGTLSNETQIGSAGYVIGGRVTTLALGSKTGVTTGTKTCKMVFKSSTPGTITVDTSGLFVVGIRTA